MINTITEMNHAVKLVKLALKKSVEHGLEQTRDLKPVLLLSGGVDSTVLHFLLKNRIPSITAGLKGSSDLEIVRRLIPEARTITLEKNQVTQALERFRKRFPHYSSTPTSPAADSLRKSIANADSLAGSFLSKGAEPQVAKSGSKLDIALGLPLFMLAEELNESKCFWLGSGAEELFLGYKYHYDYLEKNGKESAGELQESELKGLWEKDLKRNSEILGALGISSYLPFCNQELVEQVRRIDPGLNHCELRKMILRKAALELGVPEEIAMRKKVALQYGTGIGKVIGKK